MLSDTSTLTPTKTLTARCLNTPYGAPCFLTRISQESYFVRILGLNAPYGAPCFPTNLKVGDEVLVSGS